MVVVERGGNGAGWPPSPEVGQLLSLLTHISHKHPRHTLEVRENVTSSSGSSQLSSPHPLLLFPGSHSRQWPEAFALRTESHGGYLYLQLHCRGPLFAGHVPGGEQGYRLPGRALNWGICYQPEVLLMEWGHDAI